MITIKDWYFTKEYSDDFFNGKIIGEKVRIPHTVKVLPYHYINEKDYQMISGYRTELKIDEDLENKRVLIHFMGLAHISEIYIDNIFITKHLGGYTGFKVDVTDFVKDNKSHLLQVKLDSTENKDIPPFGYVIDYLTYGGMYREVYLEIVDDIYVEDVFVYTPALNQAKIEIKTNLETDINKVIKVKDKSGYLIKEVITDNNTIDLSFDEVNIWSIDNPYLYTLEVGLENKESFRTINFGFRTCVFKEDGFYLNDEKVYLIGLNRHQSYPYLGYAAPKSLQYEDARILKEELGVNAVRTSHYPQSQHFIDACDKLGLLVFTEIPGWQHIGDEKWKEVAVKNVEEMVLQYRNHPSIILWGVRINESQDDDEFYRRTNEMAHKLDPSRSTSGVRFIENSSLLEDVYGYNDFSYDGTNNGCKDKKKVTPSSKPLMITEANGHMFPTKPFDPWKKRQEHALRHAKVLNDSIADNKHVGTFQWCMFDYPTHKDFGSGDRICYHGVMDGFRNPKLAASLYASQQDKYPILEISSSMDIGDYPSGIIGEVWIFTNMDKVRLYKNDEFVTDIKPQTFLNLKHPPLMVDDLIGDLLKTKEGFTGNKEKILHECLKSAAINGINKMPAKDMIKMGYAMARYHLKYSDGVDLYGKYVGNWGASATIWRFDGIKDDKVVISKTLSQSSKLHLEIKVSNHTLIEKESYDMAMCRIRVLDENNNLAVYNQIPISLKCEGPIEIVGPNLIALEGASSGVFVRNKANEFGDGKLIISSDYLDDVEILFKVLEG